MPPELWRRAGVVADHLGTDRSALIRDFFRWLTFEDGAKAPRRPASPPDSLAPRADLPAAIRELSDSAPRAKTPRTRYVIQVDARADAVLAALVGAGVNTGSSYMETTPLQVSTFDRAQAVRIYEALAAAGLSIVES